MDPDRVPLVVSADVLRQLANDVPQPQSLGSLPQNSMQPVAARQPALPLPQIAAPADPASESLPVNQIGGQFTALSNGQRSYLSLRRARCFAELEIQAQREKWNRRGHSDGGQHPFLLSWGRPVTIIQ